MTPLPRQASPYRAFALTGTLASNTALGTRARACASQPLDIAALDTPPSTAAGAISDTSATSKTCASTYIQNPKKTCIGAGGMTLHMGIHALTCSGKVADTTINRLLDNQPLISMEHNIACEA
jgi:hypothetical protein